MRLLPDLVGWQSDAACRDTPQDWWFPESTAGPDGVPDDARACCDACPVRDRCLEHALRYERHGVWAGTSERGRDRLRRAMRIRLVELDVAETAAQIVQLADQGTPPPGVAEQLGMTVRTVYRHLEANGRGAPPTDHRRRKRSAST